METAEGHTLVTANGEGLTQGQINLSQQMGLTPGSGLGEGFHAEINGIWTAGEMNLLPTGGVTTNPMCTSGEENCFGQISNLASEGGYELRLDDGGKRFIFVPQGGH